MSLSRQSRVKGLYRSLLKEVHQLPDEYLNLFFHARLRNSFRKKSSLKSGTLIERDIRTGEKELRRLQGANRGNHQQLQRLMQMAFGRRGAFRQQLITPIIAESAALRQHNTPIIPNVERSRPPAFSPMLKALLASPLSRTGKAWAPTTFHTPPSLPSRADPTSEDARLLGPFSLRRNINIRQRFFDDEIKRVQPPLIIHSPLTYEAQGVAGSPDLSIGRRDTRKFGNAEIFYHLERRSKTSDSTRTIPKRERVGQVFEKSLATHHQEALISTISTPRFGTRPPTTIRSARFLRRRFAQALGMSPMARGEGSAVSVKISPHAVHPSRDRRIGQASLSDIKWLQK